MGNYLIAGQRINHAEENILQKALEEIYQSKSRPLCLCTEQGIPMYIAHVHGKYLVKRMPNSGSKHRPDCQAYEPPSELSGLGEILGTAIQENLEAGITTLKLDFALSKNGNRNAPTPNGIEPDSVKTDGNKLSLRGMLHYLWEEAGFNRWTKFMTDKRNWSVIQKYLYQAAINKIAKSHNLVEILYIPETFIVSEKDQISQRRLAKILKTYKSSGKSGRLMLVVGEVKNIAAARFGHKIILKHCPDYHFMMNEDLHTRLHKRFTETLELWETLPETHLIMIGTFRTSSSGVASLEEVAVINVTENWIPFETISEKVLIDTLTQMKRSFVKGLRYNLSMQKPLASVVLLDTQEATAMYIYPPEASQETIDEIDAMIQDSHLPSWKWHIDKEVMPAVPENKNLPSSTNSGKEAQTTTS